jgi:hypothetical protein
MQELINQIQETGKPVEAAQKKDTLRIIVKNIPGLQDASEFLNILSGLMQTDQKSSITDLVL